MTPDPKPKRDEMVAIVNRFLKVSPRWDAAKEMPTAYRLFARYPSRAFWERHELDFGPQSLNSMFWFMTPDGKAHLERAWVTWWFTYPETNSEVDIPSESGYTGVDSSPAPTLTPRRARSAAEFLSTNHGQTR